MPQKRQAALSQRTLVPPAPGCCASATTGIPMPAVAAAAAIALFLMNSRRFMLMSDLRQFQTFIGVFVGDRQPSVTDQPAPSSMVMTMLPFSADCPCNSTRAPSSGPRRSSGKSAERPARPGFCDVHVCALRGRDSRARVDRTRRAAGRCRRRRRARRRRAGDGQRPRGGDGSGWRLRGRTRRTRHFDAARAARQTSPITATIPGRGGRVARKARGVRRPRRNRRRSVHSPRPKSTPGKPPSMRTGCSWDGPRCNGRSACSAASKIVLLSAQGGRSAGSTARASEKFRRELAARAEMRKPRTIQQIAQRPFAQLKASIC